MPKTKLVSWVVYHVHVKIKADTKERIEEVAKKTRRDIGFDTRGRGICLEVEDDSLIVNLEKICDAEEVRVD